jgi:hypothetical protein
VTPALFEGGTASLSGRVFDPDLGDAVSVAIRWGDGKSNVLNFGGAGLNTFSIDHQYLDDTSVPTGMNRFTIDVTATDSHGESGSSNAWVVVSNAPPKLLDVVVTSPVFVGSNAVLSGSIFDAGVLDFFVLAVNWGDGSLVQNFNYPAGTTSFNENHVYAIGNTNLTIRLDLRDDDAGMDSRIVPLFVKQQAAAAHFLGLVPSGNGHVLLQLQATALATYAIETTANFDGWVEIGTATADATGALSFEDVSAPLTSRFYRAVVKQ